MNKKKTAPAKTSGFLTKLVLVSVAAVAISIISNVVLFRVSSQNGNTNKTEDVTMTVKQQEQALLQILGNKDNRKNSPEQIIDALEKLAALKNAGADLSADDIPVVVELLDFERKKQPENSLMTTEWHPTGPSETYPAIAALFYFGKPALPFLTAVIEENEPVSAKSLNSLATIRLLFRNDTAQIVDFLETAKSDSFDPVQKERIDSAIKKIKMNSPEDKE